MAQDPGRAAPSCGVPSPFYVSPEFPDQQLRDLCLKPKGHKGRHQWWGHEEAKNRRPA